MYMKTIITCIYLLFANIITASNFEVKVAIDLNNCVDCKSYLYSLNNLSKKYKITLLLNKDNLEDSAYAMEEIIGSKIKNYEVVFSDSLHKKYSFKNQNYITAFKNKEIILKIELSKIKSQIDYLNELSFESGDTIQLDYNVIAANNAIRLKNVFYQSNIESNTINVTNLVNESAVKNTFSRELTEEIFKINFKGSTEKLLEIEKAFLSNNKVYTMQISAFDVNENKIYLLVSAYYIDEILYNNSDTVYNRIIVLLVYNKGEKEPIIYPLSLKLINGDYDFSHYSLKVIDNKVLIDVFPKNPKKYNQNSYWLCKCELNENIFLDTTDCIPRPKLHVDLKLNHNFGLYKLDGDYLINTITNELINYKTKTSAELKIPFNKIITDKSSPFKFTINYSLIDFKTDNNQAQIIYYMDNAYHYLLYNLKNDKVLENYPIFTDYYDVLKAPPKLFSKNLFYIFPKSQNSMVLREIKPLN